MFWLKHQKEILRESVHNGHNLFRTNKYKKIIEKSDWNRSNFNYRNVI